MQEFFALLGCHASFAGSWPPTFRDYLSVLEDVTDMLPETAITTRNMHCVTAQKSGDLKYAKEKYKYAKSIHLPVILRDIKLVLFY